MLSLGKSAAAVTLVVALTACGAEQAGDSPAPGSNDAPFELPVSATTYDVTAPTWVVGDTVHIGEDEVTVDPAPESYVVAEHGIYFTAGRSLYFADGRGAEKIAPIGSSKIVKSADGRHLGMIDAAHGPTDGGGTHVAVPVVFDLATGEQVLRPPPGRSLEGEEDLADLYEDAEPDFLGFDDVAAYAVDPLRQGINRFPLGGGSPELVEPSSDGVPQLPPFEGQLGFDVSAERARGGGLKLAEGDPREAIYPAALSPDGKYLFGNGSANPGEFFDAETGERLSFEHGMRLFSLGGWLDDDTFYGATSDAGSLEGPEGRAVIVSCQTTGSQKCAPISEEFDLPPLSDRQPLLFATGDY